MIGFQPDVLSAQGLADEFDFAVLDIFGANEDISFAYDAAVYGSNDNVVIGLFRLVGNELSRCRLSQA